MEPISLRTYPNILLVKEAMVILRKSRKSIYKMIQNGDINGRLRAGRYEISKKSVMRYIKSLDDTAAKCYNKSSDNLVALENYRKGV